MHLLDNLTSQKIYGKLLIAYITFGFPDKPTFTRIFRKVSEIADIVELGVPFSDPIADGPTIQRCSEKALSYRVSLYEIFKFLKISSPTSPLVLMGYANPFYRLGVKKLQAHHKENLFQGMIIPDMPLEEAMRTGFYPSLPVIQLIAPTTPLKRAQILSKASSGFVYYVSITGITGSRIEDIEEIRRNITRLKKFISKPIVVGFGISTPSEAKEIASFSDGIVIGSAFLKKIEEGETKALKFLSSIKEVIT